MNQQEQARVDEGADFDFVQWKPVEQKKPMAGLGDVVAKVIHTVTGITPCAGCERRREWLNEKFPFGKNGDGVSK